MKTKKIKLNREKVIEQLNEIFDRFESSDKYNKVDLRVDMDEEFIYYFVIEKKNNEYNFTAEYMYDNNKFGWSGYLEYYLEREDIIEIISDVMKDYKKYKNQEV